MNRGSQEISLRNLSRFLLLICIVFTLLVVSATASPTPIFKTLVFFNGTNGGYPYYVALVQGTDGNLYGTTSGNVFKMTPKGLLTTLYSFCDQSDCSDGNDPGVGLVLGVDGNFYGTTNYGGTSSSCVDGCGTVFKITSNGTYTVLHSFDSSDGAHPGALVLSSDGNLYGTTSSGGSNNSCSFENFPGCGTLFKITTAGTLTTLHNFSGPDGFAPYAPLIQAIDGNFYGTTFAGGAYNSCKTGPTPSCGTVFKITPEGTLTTLHSFDGNDGANPTAALLQESNGNFYGTTWDFGEPIGLDCAYTNPTCGTYFKITPTGKLTTLHYFAGGYDAGNPTSALIRATDGNFYGTSVYGGGGNGDIYEISAGNVVTSVVGYGLVEGINPIGGLVQATNGVVFGTFTNCLNYCRGTVFSMNLGLEPFVTFVLPAGNVGATVQILGQNLTRTTSVTFNGVKATSFTVVSDTYMTAVVPSGATSGPVVVTNRTGTLTSNKNFTVLK